MTALRQGEIAHAFIWTGNYCRRCDVTSASSPLLSHFPPLCLPASSCQTAARGAASGRSWPTAPLSHILRRSNPSPCSLLAKRPTCWWVSRDSCGVPGPAEPKKGKSATTVPRHQQPEVPKSQKINYCSWTPPPQVSSYSQLLHLSSMKKNQKTNCFHSPGLHTSKVLTPWSFLKDCSKQTARCVTFTCPLLNMTKEATIVVRSRLWNSTMLEVSAPGLNAAHSLTSSTVHLMCVASSCFNSEESQRKKREICACLQWQYRSQINFVLIIYLTFLYFLFILIHPVLN